MKQAGLDGDDGWRVLVGHDVENTSRFDLVPANYVDKLELELWAKVEVSWLHVCTSHSHVNMMTL